MKSVIIILLLLIVKIGFAQSLVVLNETPQATGNIGSQIRTPILLKNTSNKTITVLAQATSHQLGSSQKSFFCWYNDCNKQDIVHEESYYNIKPGETLETFNAVLEAGLVSAKSTIIYRFINIEDTKDFAEAEIHYSVIEKNKNGSLYASANVELSDVYPNPVTETAMLDYSFKDIEKDAKIVIHNVLGSITAQFVLDPNENHLKIPVSEFNPGVYFYTLYIDNEGVATKKMVVKK